MRAAPFHPTVRGQSALQDPIATSDASHAGQAVYSRRTLALYDLVVLRISNSLIWRCPTARMLDQFNRLATAEHLDVGVGTGWYLDHCRFPVPRPRIGLMDLNPSSLAAAAARIARYAPEQHRADALRPAPAGIKPFRSISLTYLLHCLPGRIEEKAVVFDNLLPLLRPDGHVFGATLLSKGVRRSGAAVRLMRFYNGKGIFSNEQDSADALREALGERFEEVKVEIVGCGALFEASRPRTR
jgi:SAM-dependent methyltransferase